MSRNRPGLQLWIRVHVVAQLVDQGYFSLMLKAVETCGDHNRRERRGFCGSLKGKDGSLFGNDWR